MQEKIKMILQVKENFAHIYRVILKKVLFGIFWIFLIFKEEKNLTMESKDNVLPLSKFSWYFVMVKIVKIRH